MPKRGVPQHSMGRLIKTIGDIRATKGAKALLKQQLEAWVSQIAEKAIVYMRHAGRKTVMQPDIELAIRDVFKE